MTGKRKNMIIRYSYLLYIVCSLFFMSCSIQHKVGRDASHFIFTDKNFAPAHVGISLYNPKSKKYLYNHEGDKYFVPASNMKLLTCYAALKYLGDSLTAFKYEETDTALHVIPTGDPTFLHQDFRSDRVLNFLKKQNLPLIFEIGNWEEKSLGVGWAWDDYNDDYMVERSPFPAYGNIVNWSLNNNKVVPIPDIGELTIKDTTINQVERDRDRNKFTIFVNKRTPYQAVTPYVTNGFETARSLLKDTLKREIRVNTKTVSFNKALPVHSHSTDSLLKITMHRSDNFFAEQSLLMVSNERLGVMNDSKIINLLLNTDFKDLPQKPKWVDGSGLSRYNLISPLDFVAVLEKIKGEFSWSRISSILPGANTGTLSGYYQKYPGAIYAKTGTLSNNVSLSGYLTTKKGKQLIFSVLVNNHQTSASAIRRAIEKFIGAVIDKN